MHRLLTMSVAFATVLVLAGPAATAAPPADAGAGWPEVIPLPNNFFPEGIATGRGHELFAGSLLDGEVRRIDLRTGESRTFSPGVPGRVVVGLSYDPGSGLLWSVGFGESGPTVFGFDGRDGTLAHEVPLSGASFPNDLVATRGALYATDSMADDLWVVPLTSSGAPAGPAVARPLGGEFDFVTEGPLPVNLNGIDATPDGRWLLAVHTVNATLYRIDPVTLEATLVDLGGETLDFADGILLHGRRLHVVQNFPNTVATLELSPDLTSARLTSAVTSEAFDVPTTIARAGNALYVVNGRFDDSFPPFFGGDPNANLDYDVVRVPEG